MKPVVSVMTSVHPAGDTRVFHGECCSLVRRGSGRCERDRRRGGPDHAIDGPSNHP